MRKLRHRRVRYWSKVTHPGSGGARIQIPKSVLGTTRDIIICVFSQVCAEAQGGAGVFQVHTANKWLEPGPRQLAPEPELSLH